VKPPPHELTPAERVRLEIPPLDATADEARALLADARRVAVEHSDGFSTVERYCMFIGYPRSGHSVIGAMLDAHRNALIAHELNALRYIAAGASRAELFWLLARNSAEFARLGRQWGEYHYAVADQWQGRHAGLRVIGDKKGGTSSWLLGQQPELLERLKQVIGMPLVLVHVVRNPFDNVATIARKDTGDLMRAVEFYARLVATNAALLGEAGAACLTLRHEDLLAGPNQVLARIALALELDADRAWVAACAAITARVANLTRHSVTWTSAARARVERLIEGHDFLAGYAFEAEPETWNRPATGLSAARQVCDSARGGVGMRVCRRGSARLEVDPLSRSIVPAQRHCANQTGEHRNGQNHQSSVRRTARHGK